MLPGVVFGQVFTGRGQVDSNDAQFATADSNCMHDTPDLGGLPSIRASSHVRHTTAEHIAPYTGFPKFSSSNLNRSTNYGNGQKVDSPET